MNWERFYTLRWLWEINLALFIVLVDGWQDKNWRSNVEASIALFGWLVSQSASSAFLSYQIGTSDQPISSVFFITNQHQPQPDKQSDDYFCECCAFVVHNRWCTLNGWSRWGMGVWHGIIETSMTALWMVMWKMREHGGFGALRNICRLSYFLHESTVYLIAVVLMNCTQHFCFPISEVVNNDCARLPLTWDVVVTEKVHTVNTEK